jgi:hypothetical protein
LPASASLEVPHLGELGFESILPLGGGSGIAAVVGNDRAQEHLGGTQVIAGPHFTSGITGLLEESKSFSARWNGPGGSFGLDPKNSKL